MKNCPRSLFLHQTLQLALCIRAGSVLLASSQPRFVHRTAKWWSMIHHSREYVSTVPQSNGDDLYTTPANNWTWKLHMVILGMCVAARPWKPIMKLQTNSHCANVASRGSLSRCINTFDWYCRSWMSVTLAPVTSFIRLQEQHVQND
jgi:hypothetical protein